jgi:hypothetical protein
LTFFDFGKRKKKLKNIKITPIKKKDKTGVCVVEARKKKNYK